jgi:membrane protein DedA with SNARE-associated domain/rhodanese-related sulfurtransferase
MEMGMDQILELFAEHGLLGVFCAVLIEQLGVPIPALPFLLLSGVAAANDGIFAVKALFAATLASVIADSIWFFAGRHFGRRVLALLCRISISPDSCVRQSELNFAKRGVATLVVAKFIPGLSTLAPPLAGALGMPTFTFTLFNLAGTLLWAGVGIAAGLIFQNQIELLLDYLSSLGGIALSVVGILLALYLALREWRRWGAARKMANMPRVQPEELYDMMTRGLAPIIVDVSTIVLNDVGDKRIPGARHIDLSVISQAITDDWPNGAEVVTYCACPTDVSALKAAQVLAERGFKTRALAGGIDGWLDAGFELEVSHEGAQQSITVF